MTYLLHRYTGALSKSLLALIGLILLAGQITWQPIPITAATATTTATPISAASATTTATAASTTTTTNATTATTATRLSRQPARDQENSPDPHCHRKVYLLPDQRYDLKHLFFIPVPLFRLSALLMEQLSRAYSFSASLTAGAVRPASLRGPPSI
jgi:hypothetical protein